MVVIRVTLCGIEPLMSFRSWNTLLLITAAMAGCPAAVCAQQPPVASLGQIQPVDAANGWSQAASSPYEPVRQPYVAQQAFQRKVGQIFVRGNTVTKNRVVRQYLDLAPGEIADVTKLRSSQENLIATRLFNVDLPNNVFPRVEFAPTNDPYAEYQDILVTVEETQTSSLLFGAEVNSDLGVGGQIIYHERNFDLFGFPLAFSDLPYAFRGAGQEFRVEAIPGTRVHKYMVQFREPRLLGLPISIGTAGYYFRRSYSAYDEERLGGDFSFGYRISPEIGTSIAMRVQNVEISDPKLPTLPDLMEVLGDNFLLGIKLAADHDTRDSHIRPTEGHLVEAAFEQVLGSFDYPVLTLSGRQHWLLAERPNRSGQHVVTGAARIAYSGSQTPIYERFYAGGLQTIRGFQYRGVSPVTQDIEVGGDFLFLANLEYQFPLTADDNLFGVVFVDSGTVERDFEILDYRVALGAGIRVILPITGPVPLALDVAFPVSDKDTDDRQIVSFFAGFGRPR